MKLGLINSAWLGSHVGTADGIRKTKEIGFDTIDIFADPLEINIQERKLIKDTAKEAGLPIVSVACCALADGSASIMAGMALSITSIPLFILSRPNVKIIRRPSIPNLCL